MGRGALPIPRRQLSKPGFGVLQAGFTSNTAGIRGFDELDEVSGDGSAELLEEGSIEIEFAYHNGYEAVLKAQRNTSSTAC